MTLFEYSSVISEFAKKHPDLKVIYAIDSEGNGFKQVSYTPSIGKFDLGEFEVEDVSPEEINAICIN